MELPRIAFITGANRGIGFEVARQLLEQGFFVFLGIRRREMAEKVFSDIQNFKENAKIIHIDTQDEQSIAEAAKEVAQYVSHIDVLINNAAILVTGDEVITRIPSDVVLRSFQANSLGPLLVCQRFLPLLLKGANPRIINVSSSAGSLTYMEHWAPAYSISKAALNAITKQLAWALKDQGVAINAVCPGWGRTEVRGSEAPRAVDEGADSIVWLTTKAPQTLTGKFIHDRKAMPW